MNRPLSRDQALEVAKRLATHDGQVVHFTDDGTTVEVSGSLAADHRRLGHRIYRAQRTGGVVDAWGVDEEGEPEPW